MSNTDIEVDESIVKRLKTKIIIYENKNLKTKEKNEQEMINWIKRQIEDEVQSLVNKDNNKTSNWS